MGETLSLSRPTFNHSLRIESREAHLSSDCGTLLLREALERTGIIEALAARLDDPRDPSRVVHPLSELLRDALVMIAQGWGDQGDATRLRGDPLFALAGSDRRGQAAAQRPLASQSSFSRLLSLLSSPGNLEALQAVTLQLAGRRVRAAHRGRRRSTMTIDIDGVALRAHGHQSGSAYNGHTHQRQHYPLLASCAETGDQLGALLRPGTAGAADQAVEWIPQLIGLARRHLADHIRVRVDAGFTDGATLNALDAEGVDFLGRLPSNKALERLFEPHRYRAPGRPSTSPREWTVETRHKARTWNAEHRVVLVVQENPGELYRRCFFLVTNMPIERASAAFVLEHYRRRGKAEGHFGEFKSVLGESLPCTTRQGRRTPEAVFARSQALLSLRVLAYALMHLLRDELERMTATGWSLQRLRERILKVAGRVRFHARRVHVDLERRAAAHWNRLMRRLWALEPQPG